MKILSLIEKAKQLQCDDESLQKCGEQSYKLCEFPLSKQLIKYRDSVELLHRSKCVELSDRKP